jgi:hypothetical protein
MLPGSSPHTIHFQSVGAHVLRPFSNFFLLKSWPQQTHPKTDPFYGYKYIAQLSEQFITRLFACPPFPPQSTHSQARLPYFIAYALHHTKLHHSVVCGTCLAAAPKSVFPHRTRLFRPPPLHLPVHDCLQGAVSNCFSSAVFLIISLKTSYEFNFGCAIHIVFFRF